MIERRQSFDQSKNFDLFVESQSSSFQPSEMIFMLCDDNCSTSLRIITLMKYDLQVLHERECCMPLKFRFQHLPSLARGLVMLMDCTILLAAGSSEVIRYPFMSHSKK